MKTWILYSKECFYKMSNGVVEPSLSNYFNINSVLVFHKKFITSNNVLKLFINVCYCCLYELILN